MITTKQSFLLHFSTFTSKIVTGEIIDDYKGELCIPESQLHILGQIRFRLLYLS